MAKNSIWRGTISIRQPDGTVIPAAAVEDVTGVREKAAVIWSLTETEREAHADRLAKRAAQAAAELRDADGKPLLPEGRYSLPALLRSTE